MSFQVDALEQDALEVLSMVRSLKNSLAPINRIPPEILSLLPDYSDEDDPDSDQVPITLTHVCHSWREIFTSRSSLWTDLDLTSIDKTRTFIQRSKSSPLDIYAGFQDDEAYLYLDDALSLVIPHIPRLRSLALYCGAIPEALRNLCHAPLLEDLEIQLASLNNHTLDIPLLNGDLPSLLSLTLGAKIIRLPQKKMSNLRELSLSCDPGALTMTQILDFLESAPLLHIEIMGSIPSSCDALPQRIVTLRHLETLEITADRIHCIVKHLRIPVGASVKVWAKFRGEAFPLLEYLWGTSPNIKNISHTSAVNLSFGFNQRRAKLSGPSGSLCLSGHWENQVTPSTTLDYRILRALGPRILSTTERLTISYYDLPDLANIEECLVFQTLRSMNNLQSLALSRGNDQPFIFALNPAKNSSEAVLCPSLKKLNLFRGPWRPTNDLAVVDMARGRALRGARLSSVKIVTFGCTGTPVRETEMSELREHVTQVKLMVETINDGLLPSWEYLPDEAGDRWG